MEVSRRLVHCPLHSETQSHQREGRELEGEREVLNGVIEGGIR